MKTLVIAGLGPGGPGQLTAEARALLEEAQVGGRLILRTRVHPVVQDWPVLRDAPSLDHLYERSADFGEVYDGIARAVLEAVEALPEGSGAGPELVYAVPGHPAVGEATVPRLRGLAREAGIAVRLVPGLSFVDAVTTVLGGEAGEGEEGEAGTDGADLRVADALALGRVDPTVPLLVCQVYSRRVAAGVKLALGAHYPDEHPVVLVRAAGVQGQETVSRRPLYEIDRDDFPDHLTSLWVPPLAPLQARREPETLRLVMARLRAPDGCPWDREQTHASLRKYLLEETYEALEALDAGDTVALEEELGDLLLQIVFHAQIADEVGDFDLGDVVAGIVAKLIRRHPHVFGGEEAKDAEAVLRNWEALKRKERAERAAGASQDGEGAPERSMLDGVPRAMPALAYAQAVQDRAARVGFDWPDVAGVVDKVAEEARELTEAPPEGRQAELGDLLFSVVNLARRLGIDAEEALRGANGKFLARFASMEVAARRAGKTLEEYDAAGLDALWEEAKSQVSGPVPGPAGP
jgi:tetrapyrrole methylase family protein/MazG family protein